MSIEAYDFRDISRDGELISYRDLFASELPGLKGRSLSPELVEMDRKEYQTMQQEKRELKALIDKVNSIYSFWHRYILLAGISSFTGAFLAGKFGNQMLHLGFIIVIIGSVCGYIINNVIYSCNSASSHNKEKEIDDHRLIRILGKVRKFKELISATNNPDEKEELNQAKDAFKTKYEIHLLKKSWPI